MDLLNTLLAAFAVYRIAILVSEDTGPMSVFARLRSWADGKAVDGKFTNFNEAIHCAYCIGIWAAIGCALLLFYPTMIGNLFLLAFGLAGIQSFLQSKT